MCMHVVFYSLHVLVTPWCHTVHRGYYMVARRYQFYVVVARTTSHDWTSEILFLPRESKFHIFELMCNALFTDDSVLDDFPKISDHLSKISGDFPKLFRSPEEHFRTFPKVAEDCWRLSRKTHRCFDHTQMNISTI